MEGSGTHRRLDFCMPKTTWNSLALVNNPVDQCHGRSSHSYKLKHFQFLIDVSHVSRHYSNYRMFSTFRIVMSSSVSIRFSSVSYNDYKLDP